MDFWNGCESLPFDHGNYGTRVGGDKAEGIISGFPFDGFITTNKIGYVDGLWVLWNKEDVDISFLASME